MGILSQETRVYQDDRATNKRAERSHWVPQLIQRIAAGEEEGDIGKALRVSGSAFLKTPKESSFFIFDKLYSKNWAGASGSSCLLSHHLSVYMYVYACVYIYIYTERERERCDLV